MEKQELLNIFWNPQKYINLSIEDLCKEVNNLYKEDIDFIRGDTILEKALRLREYLIVSFTDN